MSYWPPVHCWRSGKRLHVGWPARGTCGGYSLFRDDVLLGQGRALHPSHLHPVGDLGEIQAQVHATDGHPRPSFWGARHCQDLEGNKTQEG